MQLRYPLTKMFHGDVDCYGFNAELIPHPLLKCGTLFTLPHEDNKIENGQPSKLNEGERLYSPFDPKFTEQLENRKWPCKFGVALESCGLVAVLIHGIKNFWTVLNSLGATCSTRNIKLDTVTMFFELTDGSLSNIDFVRTLDSRQDDEFKKLVAEKGRDALTSPMVKPAIKLITTDFQIMMDLGFWSNKEPIKEISAVSLCERLSYLALPFPLVEAHYFDGVDQVEFNGRTHYYRIRHTTHKEFDFL